MRSEGLETSNLAPLHPSVQRARINPRTLSPRNVRALQRTVGNRAVSGRVGRGGGVGTPLSITLMTRPSVQRVGGKKFGIKKAEKAKKEGVEALREIWKGYKKKLREKKKMAQSTFKNKKDITAQTTYTKALRDSEMSIEELKKRINKSEQLKIKENNMVVLKEGETPVAKLLSGESAYAIPENPKEKGEKKDEDDLKQTVYSRHTLEGLKGVYIKVLRRMLRRYAYRGGHADGD